MLFGELFEGITPVGVYGACESDVYSWDITGIATDCSRVVPGDVFVCIRGEHTDGHLYAKEAVRRGAAAIVAMEELSLSVPVIVVENTRSAAAFMWNNRYHSPAKDMTLIAVTGTNGKTSVCFLLREILMSAGHRCGLIGTVKCMAGEETLSFGGGSEIAGANAAMTTPDPEYLYGMLYEMKRRGVTHVVMEASSHALSQHKLDPLRADVAVFTGLSREHLDYHGTMENYLASKSVLFRGAVRGIINADDPYSARLCEIAPCDYVRVGAMDGRGCDIRAKGIVRRPGEVIYRLCGKGVRASVRCPMPGRFGVYNSLLAAAAAIELGVSAGEISDALGKFGGVPGRMETLVNTDGIRVIRDYAHTPDALEAAATIAAEECEGRLWLLFGCGGDRDRGKRPEMGRIASKVADHTVITSDNSRSEDRDTIIGDILLGFDRSKAYTVIPDREAAIRYAVIEANVGDTVLLCGKGHEDYEITADGMRPFDEVAIVRSAMMERQSRFGRKK